MKEAPKRKSDRQLPKPIRSHPIPSDRIESQSNPIQSNPIRSNRIESNRKQRKMSSGRMSKKMKETLKGVVLTLSEKYGFARQEAEEILGLIEKSKQKMKPSLGLPWTGEVCGDWCHGIRVGGGLYGQCTNARPIEGLYCETCEKKEDKHTVENREEWISSNGKKVLLYGAYLKKILKKRLGHDQCTTEEMKELRDEGEREAKRFGLRIPEREYEDEVSSRGRPRKTAATSDTDESSDEEPKKRGRPRKESDHQDMFATLVAEHDDSLKVVEAVGSTESEEAEWLQWKELEAADAKLKAANELEAAEKAALKEAEKDEKAKLKAANELEKAEKAALKEAEKEEKAKLKAVKELEKAEKAKLKEDKAKLKEVKELEKLKLNAEKAKFKEEREVERELRRKGSATKKGAKDANEANDEVESGGGEPVIVEESVKSVGMTCREKVLEELFGETESGGELKEEEYGNEAEVESWEHSGVKYLLNKSTGDVYDRTTRDHLGIWNGSEIEEVDSGSEAEDSD